VVKSLQRRDAKEIAKGILDRIAIYSGTKVQTDDLTMVIAKHL
jgi:serine phosphatase RsbU (regulator of sigma subunit)